MEDGQRVLTEGYFRLPYSTEREISQIGKSDDQYLLVLTERSSGTGAFITASLKTAAGFEPNTIGRLPLSFTQDDVHFTTRSGKRLGATDRVIVSGRIGKQDGRSRACILNVDTIESPR